MSTLYKQQENMFIPEEDIISKYNFEVNNTKYELLLTKKDLDNENKNDFEINLFIKLLSKSRNRNIRLNTNQIERNLKLNKTYSIMKLESISLKQINMIKETSALQEKVLFSIMEKGDFAEFLKSTEDYKIDEFSMDFKYFSNTIKLIYTREEMKSDDIQAWLTDFLSYLFDILKEKFIVNKQTKREIWMLDNVAANVYIYLSKKLKDNNDWENILKKIIDNIDFDKNNSPIRTLDRRVNSAAIKFLERIDV